MIKYNYKCSNGKCDFTYSPGNGGFAVYDKTGAKFVLPVDSREKIAETISNILNLSKENAKAWVDLQYNKIPGDVIKEIDRNTGLLNVFICTECFTENYLNEARDELKCSKCKSILVVPPMIICPKCKNGKLIRESNGLTSELSTVNKRKTINLKLIIDSGLLIALLVFVLLVFLFK